MVHQPSLTTRLFRVVLWVGAVTRHGDGLTSKRSQRLSSSPYALAAVLLINLGMTTGDQLLLHVRSDNKQLRHGAVIAIFGDTPYAHLTANDKASQVIPCSNGWPWIGSFAT